MFRGFISYSHQDATACADLRKHLRALERANLVDFWNDTRLRAGDVLHEKIIENLSIADVILLLLSPNFINSEYIWDYEVPLSKQRASDGALIVPVIVEKCMWEVLDLQHWNALPPDARPIRDFKPVRDGYHAVAKGLNAAIQSTVGD